jgi:ABC-type uncharacterized transport system permease subunit
MEYLDPIFSILRLSSPLILGMLAALFAERSGVVQLGLEGFLLWGAFVAAAVSGLTGNPWMGALAAMAVGGLMCSLYGLFVVVLRCDQIVTGTAFNLLAWGMIPFLCFLFYGVSANTPSLEQSAILPNWFVMMSPLMAVLVGGFWMARSSWGLKWSMAGAKPQVLRTLGVSLIKTRMWSLVLCGLTAGLGGALLSTGLASSYTRNMTSGRGFMALAALILGRWKPWVGCLSALLFGVLEYVQFRYQSERIFGIAVPVDLLQVLPYVAVLVILIFVSGSKFAPKYLGDRSAGFGS